MKKLAIFLVLALCLTLCGCPATESTTQTQPAEIETEPTTPPDTTPIVITPPDTTPIVTTPVTHVHSWEEQEGPSTTISCTTDFVKTYSCTCGEGKQETIPAPGHDMQDGAVTQPTCTQEGRQTKRCSRCSYAIVIETPATGHTWSDWAHETGLVHKRTCSTCGAEETQNHNIPDGDVICTDCGAAIIN